MSACRVCGQTCAPRMVSCGDSWCSLTIRREQAREREARRARVTRKGGGEFVAVTRPERLAAIVELARLGEMQAEAEARGERGIARECARRMGEVVDVLGFDPLAYVPDRSIAEASQEENALGRILASRTQKMLRALPATSSELADLTGLRASDVRGYLMPYVDRGELTYSVAGKVTTWAVAE